MTPSLLLSVQSSFLKLVSLTVEPSWLLSFHPSDLPTGWELDQDPRVVPCPDRKPVTSSVGSWALFSPPPISAELCLLVFRLPS